MNSILWILSNPVSVGFDPQEALVQFKASMREHGNDPDQFVFHMLRDHYYFVWLALKSVE